MKTSKKESQLKALNFAMNLILNDQGNVEHLAENDPRWAEYIQKSEAAQKVIAEMIKKLHK